MKHKKVRGHIRRQKGIEQWRLENLDLRLDLLEKYDCDHVDIVVHPWCDIPTVNSVFTPPKRETKQLMLRGLIDIYFSWEKQLNKIGRPYYLKIWLFEQRFWKSQVVCAMEDQIKYYENLFIEPDNNKQFKSFEYGALKKKLDLFKWEYRLDEDHIENDYAGEPELYSTYNDFLETKRWFDKAIKKAHRTTKFDNELKYYSFIKGNVWLGEIDNK